MGNASSAQSSKTQKDSKKESHSCADIKKDRRPANGNGKAGSHNSRDKHDIRTTNPFLIFFLRLRSKKPKEHVTVIARAAGKLWVRMTPEQRKKYIDLANEEKRRRQESKRKRKRLSTRSRMK